MASGFPYDRILLKLSGEAITERGQTGIDYKRVAAIADQIRLVHEAGLRIAVVIGGGNILRGQQAAEHGMERATADYMGMLATVINALALQEACEKLGMVTRVQTAIEMHNIAESYIRRRALRHLEKNRIVIFAAGTGNPYFTTDTTAALRAVEIGSQVILKATKVDGVFDSDPVNNPDARLFQQISYMEAIQRGLRVMDTTALTLCMENDMPIIVFDIFKAENLRSLMAGGQIGTFISTNSELIYA
ncbi:MAG: UMP kinase [Spirochaetales bacterium]|nr:UMP kinase [Leptospiraceae bacterium]MCP5480780.1 UMP kinase [Spirochaetales bacterium]